MRILEKEIVRHPWGFAFKIRLRIFGKVFYFNTQTGGELLMVTTPEKYMEFLCKEETIYSQFKE